MDADAFEQLVLDAIDSLPPEFAQHVENVSIQIARRPTDLHRRVARLGPGQSLYGLYEGVPLTERGSADPLLPDVITIFQEPLERDFADPAMLRAQVRRTVLHELAHFFGISDDRLHELGAY
jgi:predicted Zn-dependent protease with MMP-like domain